MPDFDPTERELYDRLGDAGATLHPTLQVLQASGQEALPPELDSRVKTHLRNCRLCSQLIEDFSTLPEIPFSSLQEQHIASKLPRNAPGTIAFPKRRILPAIASIAALLLLSAGGFLLFRKEAAQPKQSAAAPRPAVPLTVAELEIPLSPLPAPADNSLNLQTRGAHSRNPSIEMLLPAFDSYNRGDYATATQRFTPLLVQYPKSEIVPLYLGVSRLYLRRNQDAYVALTLAQQNANAATVSAAEWYLAIAAQRLHRPESRKLLTSLCDRSSSPYAAESCRIAPLLPH